MRGIGSVIGVVAGVAPKKFVHNPFLIGFGLVSNLNWTTNALQLLEAFKCYADSSVHTEDLLLDERRQRQFLKDAVDDLEVAVAHFGGLVHFRLALITKAHVLVDGDVLMSAAKQMHVLWVFEL